MSARDRYIGTWTLPSGNSCNVYLAGDIVPGTVRTDAIRCEWDRPPSPSWPRADVDHWQRVSFPEILRAVATATGANVLGVTA
jgi:hypothetical protein